MLKLLLFLLGLGVILILIGLGWWSNSISAFDEVYTIGNTETEIAIGFLIPFSIGCAFMIPGIILVIKSYKKLKMLTHNG